MRHVRIESGTEHVGFGLTRITNAETGEPIPGVANIDIHIGPMEIAVATMQIFTEFDGVAKPHWKPIFAAAGRCESCKWWAAASPEEYGGCTSPASALSMNRDFATRNDFGCILWEPKDEAE